MQSTPMQVTGKVNVALLEKADRLFRNDDEGVWVELLQNARRAGATTIDITIEEPEANAGMCLLTIQDDGCGIADFQTLLTLGGSDWSPDIESREDPAGMGFFSLCRSEVTVSSLGRCVKITPAVFLGQKAAKVENMGESFQGTRVCFSRASKRAELEAALRKVTKFYPLPVRLDREELPRRDFLEGASHREVIDGIEVGFGTSFEHDWNWYRDGNWNFYGARIREDFLAIDGFLPQTKPTSPVWIHARFNVLETARVKLQLPDRRAIIHDEQLTRFLAKARAAAYRFFKTQASHALPFENWKEAQTLGIDLPEAVKLLSSWHASPQDDNVDPLFGYPSPFLLTTVSDVLLVGQDLPDEYTLEGAFECGAALDFALYKLKPEFEGYTWYDALPRLVTTAVFVDDVAYEQWLRTSERPNKIEVEVTIQQARRPERRIRLAAAIHAPSTEINNIEFVAVKHSPWDNDELAGPFPVAEFLLGASFGGSDDIECDSWETQKTEFERDIEREVNAYFRGPRATLLALLRDSIRWDARQLAQQLAVKEVRFKRTVAEPGGWGIELVT